MNDTGLPTDTVTTLPSVFDPQMGGQFGDTGSGFGGFAAFGAIFGLISLAIVVVVVLMIVRGIKEATSPRIEGSGRVVAKRMPVSGGSPGTVVGGGIPMAGGGTTPGMVTGGTSASTWYYATIEDSTGNRREWHVSGRMFGMLAEGDRGRTVTKGTRLLEFRRTVL